MEEHEAVSKEEIELLLELARLAHRLTEIEARLQQIGSQSDVTTQRDSIFGVAEMPMPKT